MKKAKKIKKVTKRTKVFRTVTPLVSNIKVPRKASIVRTRSERFPFKSMKKGSSFAIKLLPTDTDKQVRNLLHSAVHKFKKLNSRFKLREFVIHYLQAKKEVRVWRIK